MTQNCDVWGQLIPTFSLSSCEYTRLSTIYKTLGLFAKGITWAHYIITRYSWKFLSWHIFTEDFVFIKRLHITYIYSRHIKNILEHNCLKGAIHKINTQEIFLNEWMIVLDITTYLNDMLLYDFLVFFILITKYVYIAKRFWGKDWIRFD